MFSGKTSELIRRIRRLQIAKRKCLVIKYCGDTRYSIDDASTHDKVTIPAHSASRLSDVPQELVDSMDVIGIDEGQFFPDVVDFCETRANSGQIVVVAALSGTFERKQFGDILNLIPMAEKVDVLTSVCSFCLKDAAFTVRLSQDKAIQVIGGSDQYVASCRRCFGKRSYHSPMKVRKRPATGTPLRQVKAKKLAFDDPSDSPLSTSSSSSSSSPLSTVATPSSVACTPSSTSATPNLNASTPLY